MEETKDEIIEYKIYQIVCNETGKVYFGKTTKSLEERLRRHCGFDNTCTSKQIIERDNYYIEEINSTFDEKESINLERFYIETFECVNRMVPGRTYFEWYQINKDKKSIQKKEWYSKNIVSTLENKKDYYIKNRDKLEGEDFAYAFSPLLINKGMNADEKFKEHMRLTQELNDIYEMMPESLIKKDLFNDPKSIQIDKFMFE